MKAKKLLTATLIITTTIVACHKDPVTPSEPLIAASRVEAKRHFHTMIK